MTLFPTELRAREESVRVREQILRIRDGQMCSKDIVGLVQMCSICSAGTLLAVTDCYPVIMTGFVVIIFCFASM